MVAIKGQWRPAPSGKNQAYELQAEEVHVVGAADPEVIHACLPAFDLHPLIEWMAVLSLAKEVPDYRIPTKYPSSSSPDPIQCIARAIEVRV